MAKLLRDSDIREFITNGFLRLEPDIDSNIHKLITNIICFAVEEEGCVSNNIVSRVPELWRIIRSPCVHGAISSLLGKNYYVHPHYAQISIRNGGYDPTSKTYFEIPSK